MDEVQKFLQSQYRAPALSFTPSPYQEAIFQWITSGKGHATVEAVAGSGKSTTLAAGTQFIPPNVPAIALAFNKAIADANRWKFPPHVASMTFHSLGLTTLKTRYPKIRVEANKMRMILRRVIPGEMQDEYFWDAAKLCGLAKNAGWGFFELEAFADFADFAEALCEYHDLTPEGDPTRLFRFAERALEMSFEQTELCDFDDMLLIPLVEEIAFPRFGFVLVDEAQDLNGIQREIASRLLTPQGRLLAVGDSYQAIYAFRGASWNSMDLFRRDFQADTLPLSISYRCPTTVVEAAKKFCPNIEPAPTAPAGTVRDLTDDWEFPTLSQPSTAVICRLNRPLLALAYQLIRSGIRCHVLGRDIGEGLKSLVKKFPSQSMGDFIQQLRAYAASEAKKFQARDESGKAERLFDKIEALIAISNLCNTPDELPDEINKLFDPSRGGVVLSSVHKAKGLEWENVFILDRWALMPSKFARTEEALRQERNLIYVAYTRAKTNLAFITSKAD